MAVTADLVAVAFARFASPNPDGLAFVSQNLGLAAAAGEAPVGRSWSDNGIEISPGNPAVAGNSPTVTALSCTAEPSEPSVSSVRAGPVG